MNRIIIVVNVYRGNKGDPVAKLDENYQNDFNGKVFLFDRESPLKPKVGEKWQCRVICEKGSFGILQPMERIERLQIIFDEAAGCFKEILRSGRYTETLRTVTARVVDTKIDYCGPYNSKALKVIFQGKRWPVRGQKRPVRYHRGDEIPPNVSTEVVEKFRELIEV